MRLLSAIGALILCFIPANIRAQEPALPAPETQDSLAASASGTNALKPPAPQLIPLPPETSPPSPTGTILPTIPQLDEVFKQNPLSVTAENSKHHLEWRELRNKVATDLDVKKALAAAEAAGTDLQKRHLLQKYYELYFGRMASLAPTPELKAFLNVKKTEQLATLPQPRVRPTPLPTKAKG